MKITLPRVELKVFGTMLVLFVDGVDTRESWTPDESYWAHSRRTEVDRALTTKVIGNSFTTENKVRACLRQTLIPWDKFLIGLPKEVQELVR